MARVAVPFADRHLFEGAAFGLAHLTVVAGESHPGQGVPLNRHDCEELIVVHAGRGTYTVGDTTTQAGTGEVVVIPSGVPHRWVNHTQEPWSTPPSSRRTASSWRSSKTSAASPCAEPGCSTPLRVHPPATR